MIKLSNRMESVVSMVTPSNPICDVGCDHGYISIALVERGLSPTALAMDINPGPLERAKENIKGAGLEDRITIRLSDGLREYAPGEAKTLIITGMGGPLIQDILSYDLAKTNSFSELILSPQSEIREFRIYLSDNGYTILDEDMVLEDGKFYVILKAVRRDPESNTEVISDQGLSFGPVLLKKKHPVLGAFLVEEIKKKEDVLCKLKSRPASASVTQRIKELQGELGKLRAALRDIGL